jgi:chlorobactene glucosyltransferase
MYHNFREIWAGWTKNLFAGTEDRLHRAFFFIFVAVLFSVAPPLLCLALACAAWVTGSGWWIAAGFGAASLLMTAVRMDGNRVLRQPRWYALLYPLSAAIVTVMFVASTSWRRFGRGAPWRGRRYPIPSQRDKIFW